MAGNPAFSPSYHMFAPSDTTTLLAKDVTSNPINAGMLFNSQMDDSLRNEMYMRAMREQQQSATQQSMIGMREKALESLIGHGTDYVKNGAVDLMAQLARHGGINIDQGGGTGMANLAGLQNVMADTFQKNGDAVDKLAQAGKIVQMPDGRLATSVNAVPAQDYMRPGEAAQFEMAKAIGADKNKASVSIQSYDGAGNTVTTKLPYGSPEAEPYKLNNTNAGTAVKPDYAASPQVAQLYAKQLVSKGYRPSGSPVQQPDGTVRQEFSGTVAGKLQKRVLVFPAGAPTPGAK